VSAGSYARRVLDAKQPPGGTRAERRDQATADTRGAIGSKRQLILAVLEAENERLLERQREMFDAPKPLWVRWDLACDFLDTDLESGYVRILQEMIAAGWSDPEVAAAVREMIGAWPSLLAEVARREQERGADLGEFTADEIGALMAMPFLGAEELILLGVAESTLPMRSALRKIGLLLRRIAEPQPDPELDAAQTAR
jgi:hypothetical protein